MDAAAKKEIDFRDLTVTTSLGAVCFLISITLGSGSYKDIMPLWLGAISEIVLTTGLSLLTGLFLVFLTEFVSHQLGLGEPKKYDVKWLRCIRLAFMWIGITLLGVAIAIQLWHVILENRGDRNVYSISIILALLAGASGTIFLVAHMIYDMLREGWRTYLFAAVFGAVASVVWLNAYRDAAKSALSADSEYCYWLGGITTDGLRGETEAERLLIERSKATYREDEACKRLRENGVLHPHFPSKALISLS